MAWIVFNSRPQEQQDLIAKLASSSGVNPEDYYNSNELGLLSEQGLAVRLAEQPFSGQDESPMQLPRFKEGEGFDTEKLRYLRNHAPTPEDRAWADHVHKRILLDLWAQHIAETGETYYPPLAEDLMQVYELENDAYHS